MKKKQGGGETLYAIAKRITEAPAANPWEIAVRIKQEAPALADLDSYQLEQIARLVMTQRLTAELNTAIDLAGIDWKKERGNFLSDTRSAHTRLAYGAALDRLEAWAEKEKINPLELSKGQADSFIRELRTGTRAAASVRRDIAAVSAFYTFLERYHGAVKNPIKGTRIRPPNENKKETVIPTPKEYQIILSSLPPVEKAIIVTLSVRGLRAGALPTLELKAGKYHGKSKGKPLKENNTAGITLPREALSAIMTAGLDVKKPFALYSTSAIERRVNRRVGELYQAGTIRAPYSAHDFRHYFAVTEYKKRKDIYRLSMLLNHANVTITQTYLKSLDIKL
jgi:integrase